MAIYDYKNNYIYVSYPLWKEVAFLKLNNHVKK